MKLNPETPKHYLKTWPEYFQQVKKRKKKFEIRLNNRNYQRGDILILQEFNPATQNYTGSADITAVVTYTLQNETFLQPGYIAMSINIL